MRLCDRMYHLWCRQFRLQFVRCLRQWGTDGQRSDCIYTYSYRLYMAIWIDTQPTRVWNVRNGDMVNWRTHQSMVPYVIRLVVTSCYSPRVNVCAFAVWFYACFSAFFGLFDWMAFPFRLSCCFTCSIHFVKWIKITGKRQLSHLVLLYMFVFLFVCYLSVYGMVVCGVCVMHGDASAEWCDCRMMSVLVWLMSLRPTCVAFLVVYKIYVVLCNVRWRWNRNALNASCGHSFSHLDRSRCW